MKNPRENEKYINIFSKDEIWINSINNHDFLLMVVVVFMVMVVVMVIYSSPSPSNLTENTGDFGFLISI